MDSAVKRSIAAIADDAHGRMLMSPKEPFDVSRGDNAQNEPPALFRPSRVAT